MLVRSWRLATIMLTALSMGTALCHLMELPAKLRMPGEQWTTLLHTLYPPTFGSIGAVFEVGAVLTAVVLVMLVRGRPAFGWTLLGAGLLLITHAIFWVWIAPVNAVMGAATPTSLPSNWDALRHQWEYSHATRALLEIGALAALVQSVLVETPRAP